MTVTRRRQKLQPLLTDSINIAPDPEKSIVTDKTVPVN